jgi:hypothetical protein
MSNVFTFTNLIVSLKELEFRKFPESSGS